MVRGVRGAITVENNTPGDISIATKELLTNMLEANRLKVDDIISAIFTVTVDLDAGFPASSAREMGWDRVPMLCMTEVPVPGALPRCIRVLLHVYTELSPKEIKHIYLRKAVNLRRDLMAL